MFSRELNNHLLAVTESLFADEYWVYKPLIMGLLFFNDKDIEPVQLSGGLHGGYLQPVFKSWGG